MSSGKGVVGTIVAFLTVITIKAGDEFAVLIDEFVSASPYLTTQTLTEITEAATPEALWSAFFAYLPWILVLFLLYVLGKVVAFQR